MRYMAAIQDRPVIVLDGKVLLPWSTKTIAKVVEAFTVLSLRDQLGQLPMPCNSPTSLRKLRPGGVRIRGLQHKDNTHLSTTNEKLMCDMGAVRTANQYNGIWRAGVDGSGSLKQRKDVALHVWDGPIVVFHDARGLACQSGCRYTRRVLANIKGVGNRSTLSPSIFKLVCGKDYVCRSGKTISSTAPATLLRIHLPAARQNLNNRHTGSGSNQ